MVRAKIICVHTKIIYHTKNKKKQPNQYNGRSLALAKISRAWFGQLCTSTVLVCCSCTVCLLNPGKCPSSKSNLLLFYCRSDLFPYYYEHCKKN